MKLRCKVWGHKWYRVRTSALFIGFYFACRRCDELVTPRQQELFKKLDHEVKV